MRKLHFILMLFSLLFAAGCSRSKSENFSEVRLVLPKLSDKIASQGATVPSQRKVCYSIHITGEGIPGSPASSCGPSFGLLSGSVAEGAELSVMVPKGNNRKFELLVHLLDPSQSCPVVNAETMTSPQNLFNSFSSGSAENVAVNLDVQYITIQLDFPGIDKPLAVAGGSSCANGNLKASLLSNGDVLDAGGGLISSISHPTNESFFLTNLTDALGLGMISSGGMINLLSMSPLLIKPQVFSVTRKPDTGELFGLVGDGQIVKIDATSGDYQELSLACPFAVTNCKVPVWLQSISAGYGPFIFGLDHGGEVYSLVGAEARSTGLSVDPQVVQISFY